MRRIIILCLVTVFITLFLFNLQNLLPGFDFKRNTLAQFGSFYGGVLGTIVTFVGLYFIYRTYKQQLEQLDIAKKDADFEIINKLYNDLLQEINSIQYRKAKNEKGQDIMHVELYQGIDALYNFDDSHWRNPNSVINHLNSVLLSFEHLIFMSKKVKYKYKDMEEIMLSKIYFLFYSKIVWPACDLYTKRGLLGLTKSGSDSMLFFLAYEKMTKESIKYLIEKKRITKPEHPVIAELIQ